MRYNRTALYLTLFALFTCSLALAQENTGSILGTVTDQSGGVVPEAKVVATSPSVPRGVETVSDSNGNYVLARLPIGTYAVTVSKTGFNTIRQQEIEVQLGSQRTFNPKLTVGQVAEVIEISSTAVGIDTTSSRTSSNISQSEFERLAKGRTFNSILNFAPGVRTEIKNGSVGVGGIQVDGASGSENAYIIDGVEVTDVRRGSLRPQSAIPLDFVQELQVKSGGFEAEYGGATGGVINVATRAGSNDFHGEGYFQWTGSGLNAKDRGYWQRSAANAAVAEFFQPKEDDYHIYYPGFRFGGPILKDRLFFSTAYSPEFEKTSRAINFTNGTNKTFEQKITRHYGFGRVDYSPFSRLQINSSYIWSPQKIDGYLPQRDPRVAPPSNDLSIQGGYSPVQASTVSATWTASPKLIIQGRYGYRYFNDKLATTGLSGNYGLSTAPYLIYGNSSQGLAGVPVELQQANGYRNVSSTFGIQKDITTRNNVYFDGTYIAGKHTFKTGYQINRLSNDVLNDYTNGFFNIYWNQSFSRGSVRDARGAYGYYIWDDGVKNSGSVNSRNQGFYFQDSWRVLPTLTLNLGLRFENEFLPPFKAEVNGKKVANPVSFGWGDKVAPRLGAAWDILGDGKWKLSGSFGQFYDQLKYELARGSFGSDYWFSHVYTLDKPASLLSLGFATPGAASNGAAVISYDNRTLPINAQGEIEGIDPDIKPYKTQEFTVNLEHSLTSRMVAAIRYTHKGLLRSIEDIGVLDADDNEVYLTGNPGFGQTRDTSTDYGKKTPNGKEFLVPKAIRDYDAVEFRLQGNAMKNLFMLGSYTWSRLYGNYSGAANSDESGRSDPGVSRAYDLPFYYFDATGSQLPSLGRLGTDRPHTFKFFGSYDVPWGRVGNTNFGLNQIAYSGTPDTTSVIYQSAPTLPFGRGDLGRTPVLTQTDLLLTHSFNIGERTKARFEANFINLFNQAAVISRTTQMNRSGAVTAAVLPLSKFFSGYNPRDYINLNGTGGLAPVNPIYGLPGASYRAGGGPGINYSSAYSATFPGFGAYQDFRTIRLGVRFIF